MTFSLSCRSAPTCSNLSRKKMQGTHACEYSNPDRKRPRLLSSWVKPGAQSHSELGPPRAHTWVHECHRVWSPRPSQQSANTLSEATAGCPSQATSLRRRQSVWHRWGLYSSPSDKPLLRDVSLYHTSLIEEALRDSTRGPKMGDLRLIPCLWVWKAATTISIHLSLQVFLSTKPFLQYIVPIANTSLPRDFQMINKSIFPWVSPFIVICSPLGMYTCSPPCLSAELFKHQELAKFYLHNLLVGEEATSPSLLHLRSFLQLRGNLALSPHLPRYTHSPASLIPGPSIPSHSNLHQFLLYYLKSCPCSCYSS